MIFHFSQTSLIYGLRLVAMSSVLLAMVTCLNLTNLQKANHSDSISKKVDSQLKMCNADTMNDTSEKSETNNVFLEKSIYNLEVLSKKNSFLSAYQNQAYTNWASIFTPPPEYI